MHGSIRETKEPSRSPRQQRVSDDEPGARCEYSAADAKEAEFRPCSEHDEAVVPTGIPTQFEHLESLGQLAPS
jgi:hypothetical protein